MLNEKNNIIIIQFAHWTSTFDDNDPLIENRRDHSVSNTSPAWNLFFFFPPLFLSLWVTHTHTHAHIHNFESQRSSNYQAYEYLIGPSPIVLNAVHRIILYVKIYTSRDRQRVKMSTRASTSWIFMASTRTWCRHCSSLHSRAWNSWRRSTDRETKNSPHFFFLNCPSEKLIIQLFIRIGFFFSSPISLWKVVFVIRCLLQIDTDASGE